MLQFTPAYFFSDGANLAKKNSSCERALSCVDIETTNFQLCQILYNMEHRPSWAFNFDKQE